MTRKPEHLAILEHRQQLAGVRADAQRIVRAGMLRAFPDLILPPDTPGECRRCRHGWKWHGYVRRWATDRKVVPCSCCDRYLRRPEPVRWLAVPGSSR